MKADLAPVAATSGAQWLAPSTWPAGSAHLCTPRPFRIDEEPLPVLSRYYDVRNALLAPDGTLSRFIPFSIIPEERRHRTLYASWNLDGEEHALSRQTVNRVNAGSSPRARDFTRRAAGRLLAELMRQEPPWDISGLIYEVSMQLVVREIMHAPMLVPHVRRLRELVHDHVTAETEIERDFEAERILESVVAGADELPPGGLARHLVDVHRALPDAFTFDHLLAQLWLLVVSSETQATQLASLFGMLLETGTYEYARRVLDDAEAMKRLVSEGARRAIVFPVKLFLTTKALTADGQTLPAGKPLLISYAAANLDPDVFDAPLTFDPRRIPREKHLAFGVGSYRCLGEASGYEFLTDMLRVLLTGLPEKLELPDGRLQRETGHSLSVTCLPVQPAERLE